jgi:hypothetical protein
LERKARDSCGRTGQGRPHRRLSAEEAPRNARGKRSAWSANQQTGLTKPLFLVNLRKSDWKNSKETNIGGKIKKIRSPSEVIGDLICIFCKISAVIFVISAKTTKISAKFLFYLRIGVSQIFLGRAIK